MLYYNFKIIPDNFIIMKILIVTAMFPPIRTGTSFYSYNVANALVDQGHQVTVVSLKNKEAKDESCRFDIIRLNSLHLNWKKYFKHFRISSVFPKNYFRLNKIAKESGAEIILLVNHYLDIAFPAIYAAKRSKLPLLVSLATPLQSTNKLKNFVFRILDRFICGNIIYPACKRIISWDLEIHRYIAERQNKKTTSKSVIVPFGVNGSKEQYIGYRHNYSNVGQIIGVGAVIDQRNFLFHIHVFKELLKDFPNLILKIIGHVYIDSAIKLARKFNIEKNIVFTGEMAHEDVLKEMKQSVIHWMMLSGEYVGLGTSTIEAMLLGIPVISNAPENLLGKNELKDMENYIFTNGKSKEEILSKIYLLLKDEQLRKKIGLNGAFFVQKELTWPLVASKMTDLFQQVLSEK